MIQPSGFSLISTTDLYDSNTVKDHTLGQLVQTVDGRKFRYAKCGATATVTGDCYSSAAQDAQFQTMATAAATAIGDNIVYTTNGTTTVAANDFDEGYLMISSSTGIGQSSFITSHTTGGSGAAVNYTIADPVKVALVAAASTVTVIKNPFDDIVIQATTPVASTAGISQFAIVAAEFGWIQTGGPAAALWDATVAAVDNLGVAPSTSTAGCVTVAYAASEVIGMSMQVVPVSARVCPVFLTID